MSARMRDNGGVERIAGHRLTVDIDPDAGGRVAQISADGVPLLVGHGEVPADLLVDGEVPPTAWGAYPMVPWAGRIRRGRFEFRGREYRLPIDFGDHSIHGVGCRMPWRVSSAEPHRVTLSLAMPADERWPFGGTVEQVVSVDDVTLRLEMTVTAGEHAFPCSFGWHPWFRAPSALDFHPARMFRRDDEGIAVLDLVEVPPGPWDDCFTNHMPVGLTIDGVRLRLTSDCTNWVVYDERAHATCVEPQTGPPDAFTIAPRVLEPGRSHAAWFEIAVVD